MQAAWHQDGTLPRFDGKLKTAVLFALVLSSLQYKTVWNKRPLYLIQEESLLHKNANNRTFLYKKLKRPGSCIGDTRVRLSGFFRHFFFKFETVMNS